MEENIASSSKIQATKDMIAELFASSNVSENSIREFQKELWDNLLFFRQASNILDLHKIPRNTVISNINDSLMERTRALIEIRAEKNDKKVQKNWSTLLKSGYQYISHPYMRPRVMQVLSKMSSIKERFLNPIIQNPELYADAPIEVLRHIWMENPNTFRDAVIKVIKNYCDYQENQLMDCDSTPVLFVPPKRRRKQEHILKLVNMIGDKPELYEKMLDHIRENYLETGLNAVCSLRGELLLALNDHKLDELCVKDLVHKFAWCMDSCIRDRKIDAKHANELSLFYQDIQKIKEQCEIDIKMLCRDPHALHTFCNSIIKHLISAAYEERIPREVEEMNFLQHLLLIGIDTDIPEVALPASVLNLGSPPRHSSSKHKHRRHNDTGPTDLKTVMSTRILPAMLHLHMSAWQSQVADEIIASKTFIQDNITSKIVSASGSEPRQGPTASDLPSKEALISHTSTLILFPAPVTVASSSKSEKHKSSIPDLEYVRTPKSYLCHPLGQFLAQYHALVLVEKQEWIVLKSLLHALAEVKTDLLWRPECVQALVLCAGVTPEQVRCELLLLVRDLIPLDSHLHIALCVRIGLMLPTDQFTERENCLNMANNALPSLNMGSTPKRLANLLDELKKILTQPSSTTSSVSATPRPYSQGAMPSRMLGMATPRIGLSSQNRFSLPPGTPFINPGIPATPMHIPQTPQYHMSQNYQMMPPPSTPPTPKTPTFKTPTTLFNSSNSSSSY